MLQAEKPIIKFITKYAKIINIQLCQAAWNQIRPYSSAEWMFFFSSSFFWTVTDYKSSLHRRPWSHPDGVRI